MSITRQFEKYIDVYRNYLKIDTEIFPTADVFLSQSKQSLKKNILGFVGTSKRKAQSKVRLSGDSSMH